MNQLQTRAVTMRIAAVTRTSNTQSSGSGPINRIKRPTILRTSLTTMRGIRGAEVRRKVTFGGRGDFVKTS